MLRLIFCATIAAVIVYVGIRELGSPEQAEAAKDAARSIGSWVVDHSVEALVDFARWLRNS